MLEMEAEFRDKVKDRLRDTDIAEKFLDCIRSFKSKIATAAQFRILVIFLLLATFFSSLCILISLLSNFLVLLVNYDNVTVSYDD